MPVAKKHEHWCPNNCGRRFSCRAYAMCGGESGPTDEPCWRALTADKYQTTASTMLAHHPPLPLKENRNERTRS